MVKVDVTVWLLINVDFEQMQMQHAAANQQMRAHQAQQQVPPYIPSSVVSNPKV